MFRASRAFTLVELLAVIAVIAILAGIVIGGGRRAAEAGRIARTHAELAALSSALEAYKRQYGDYPRTNDARQLLQALVGKLDPNGNPLSPAGRGLLDLPILTTDAAGDPLTNSALQLVDPWGQPYAYAYRHPAAGWTNPSFVLYSLGPDGEAAPTLRSGGYADREADANLDNVYGTP